MSKYVYADDAPTTTGRQDMRCAETIPSRTKTSAIYVGEQDGCIRYGERLC